MLSGIGICSAAGVLLTILAPYGTGQMPIFPRLAYWTILCIAGGLGAAAFLPLTRVMKWQPSFLWHVIGQSCTSSILVTAILIGWNSYRGNSLDIIEACVLFFFVLVIGTTITAVINLVERPKSENVETPNHRPALFDRLKPKLRNADIYALSAEDHYVRIITSKGEDLVLIRLSDAIKELGHLRGLQVHRSWWVAEDGIKSVTKSDQKISIELHTGQIAPVSRGKSKTVKDAGWV